MTLAQRYFIGAAAIGSIMSAAMAVWIVVEWVNGAENIYTNQHARLAAGAATSSMIFLSVALNMGGRTKWAFVALSIGVGTLIAQFVLA